MQEIKSLSLSECAERLISIKDPVVAMHVRPDGDTVGSCSALLGIFDELGVSGAYICSDRIPDRLTFLLEGYEKAEPSSGKTVVSIDVASPSQLGSLYETDLPVLSIDHHEKNTPYCDNYTVGGVSSAGEVLFGIACELQRQGRIRITKKIAESLYAAIASDTGGFLFSNATEQTYRCAAELVAAGIDHAEINRRLFSSKSADQLRAEGYSGANIRTAKNGRISYLTISKKDREDIGLPFPAFETSIDVVRSLMGAEISFVVKETDGGEFKASLRSVGANVSEVAARHSGGGHIRAAGCTVKAESCKEAADILIAELSRLL